MKRSNVASFATLAAVSMPFVCTAADLLDAPGPGYFRQSERLYAPQQPGVAPKLSPSIQIYPANGAFSLESLTEMEQAIAKANRLIQSTNRPSDVKVTETVKPQPQPMRSAPEKAQ